MSWKEKARNTVGASASIGIAVGGAAATAAGGAVAVLEVSFMEQQVRYQGEQHHDQRAERQDPPPPGGQP